MSPSAPLYNGIREFSNEKKISFHMPGHKNGFGFEKDEIKDVFSMDVTELEETDDLHDARGYIKKAQSLAAEAFGAKRTFFCVNGSTGAIHAALMAVCKPGDTVIADRNAHASVVNASVILGIHIVFCNNSYLKEFGVYTPPRNGDIFDMISKYPHAKAFFITSPNYYGICADIGKISQLVHEKNMCLIVDEAHGAHFNFSYVLPESAIINGADIVVQSAHKTLCAPTQTAFLHLCSFRADVARLESALSMLQSSSPSYILMCYMDLARAKATEEWGRRYPSLISEILCFCRNLEGKTLCKCLGNKWIGYSNIYDIDITRLVINFSSYDVTGMQVLNILRGKYSIYAEMADSNNIVCIITPANTREDLMDFMESITSICGSLLPATYDKMQKFAPQISGVAKMSPHKAYYAQGADCQLGHCIGKISKNTICIYPPNIPIVIAGEEMTEQMVETIIDAQKNGLKITNLENNIITTIEN